LPPIAAPTPQPVVPQAEAPRFTPPTPVNPAAPRRAPGSDLPDGDITLTIKGPIHIARSADSNPKPQFIAEPALTD
ncbi:MAG: hypothetical protein WBG08_10180, partial [Litorimonas sp.]